MPSQPEAFPDMSADPTLQVAESASGFGQSVVPPPAAHVSAPLIAQLVTGATSSSVPHLSHLGLESLQTLRRYSDPLRRSSRKPKNLRSQTLPVPLLAAFTFKRSCFSIQCCIEVNVRSAAAELPT
jgi:hypothetical protein